MSTDKEIQDYLDANYTYKYYLKASWQEEWQEVTKEAFIKAERGAGFRPKLSSDHPNYMKTCATGGFSDGNISGKVVSTKKNQQP